VIAAGKAKVYVRVRRAVNFAVETFEQIAEVTKI